MTVESIAGVLVKVWVVRQTIDEMGRTGGVVCVGSTEQSAKELAKGKGSWGGDNSVSEGWAIEKLGNREVLLLLSPEPMLLDADLPKIRAEKLEAAQAKARDVFTPEERELLGLKLKD